MLEYDEWIKEFYSSKEPKRGQVSKISQIKKMK